MRTPEQGHTRRCLAHAMICAIENLRDVDDSMGAEYEAARDFDFRIALQNGVPLEWADLYLSDGTVTCLCDD